MILKTNSKDIEINLQGLSTSWNTQSCCPHVLAVPSFSKKNYQSQLRFEPVHQVWSGKYATNLNTNLVGLEIRDGNKVHQILE